MTNSVSVFLPALAPYMKYIGIHLFPKDVSDFFESVVEASLANRKEGDQVSNSITPYIC